MQKSKAKSRIKRSAGKYKIWQRVGKWVRTSMGREGEEEVYHIYGEEKPFGYQTEIWFFTPRSAATSTSNYVVRYDKGRNIISRREFKTETGARKYLESLIKLKV